MSDIVVTVFKYLSSSKFDLTDEKRTQEGIATILSAAGVQHQREHRLSDSDIIDFYLDGIGIEVKLKGTKKNIYRQLRRYAIHPDIRALILLTNVSMGLPGEIEGKPVYFLKLGNAWL